ncbi:MAG: DivIVA domain-containing protein [Coriobacteriia bacterium]|nr:DivIVA domain-containing protein [Coriobacteriia bacterium]
MKITSMDVNRKEFGHAVRGYREDEVDDFLDAIAVELDRLQAQIEDLVVRAQQSESQALNFEAERNTINNALLTAQRASDDVLEQAKEKSKKLLEDADARAKKTLQEAQREKQSILENLKHLKDAEEKFRMGILEHAQETMDSLREIPVPRVPKQREIPITKMKSPEPAKQTPAPVEASAANTAVAASVPAAPAPQIIKEEGIGQFGEMEDDLETID